MQMFTVEVRRALVSLVEPVIVRSAVCPVPANNLKQPEGRKSREPNSKIIQNYPPSSIYYLYGSDSNSSVAEQKGVGVQGAMVNTASAAMVYSS